MASFPADDLATAFTGQFPFGYTEQNSWMPLSTGTLLGPYEIATPLGAGGMGEVYRAKDTRLGRDVAIKVSSEQFSERFEREARSIAALNHPNICHLYDVGPNYLVMELIEGQALSGPLPITTALDYASQIADALEAAHERGIVHRDLKPANILITSCGVVKVLDFGLAKNSEPFAGDPASSPTVTMSPTQAGMIVGTAAYMAPEQARGKIVDKRADIWAFGCVLYYMLTGEGPFPGETIADILAAVVKNDPDLSRVPAETRRLLQRCLEKDPKKRLRDIGDYADLLVEAAPLAAAPKRAGLAWAIAGVTTIAAIGLAAWVFSRPVPAPQVTRFQIYAPPGSTLPRDVPAPSPDGRMLAYVVQGQDGLRRIHVRVLDSTESRALAGTEGANHPFWSPDGQSLAFVTGSDLKRVDLAGGSPRILAPTFAPWQGSWGKSGILYATGLYTTGLMPPEGGPAAPVIKLDQTKGETSSHFPVFLSDGKRFLIEISHTNGTQQVDLASPGLAERKLVLPSTMSAPILAPASNGRSYILYLNDIALMAQEFDEKAGVIRGPTFLLADDVNAANRFRGAPAAAASANVLAYQTGNDDALGQSEWFDRSGKLLTRLPPGSGGSNLAISPDGRFAAFDKQAGLTADIWVTNLSSGSSTRFTFATKRQFYSNPVWSPDGTRIAFTLRNTAIYFKDANGTGVEERLGSSRALPLSWSPDGAAIVTVGRSRLFLLSMDSKKSVPIGPDTGVSPDEARLSPNGRYFAYSASESGSVQVYVQAVPPGNGKWQISAGGGAQPRWRRDGKELFFVSPDQKIMAVDMQAATGAAAGAPHALFPLVTRTPGVRSYDVSADGRRFLISSSTSSQVSDAPITVVLNWWAGLKGN